MPTVQIKDEARIGSEARIKLQPSVYLEKLFQTGTPDLGWMSQHGEWGMRAKPGNLGLRLKDIEIGSYGVIPDRGGEHRSMAPRGSVVPSDVPSLGFTVNEKAECWADNAMELYEEAVARQSHPAIDAARRVACQIARARPLVVPDLPARPRIQRIAFVRAGHVHDAAYHDWRGL